MIKLLQFYHMPITICIPKVKYKWYICSL